MTWTYSATDLSTDLAKVRLSIGDTDTDDQLLTDEEINHYISAKATLDLAAEASIVAIIAKLARQIDRNTTGFSTSRSQKLQHYRDLLDERKKERASGLLLSAVPSWGGTSISDKSTAEQDSDHLQHPFQRDQHDNPGTSTSGDSEND